MSYDFKSNKGMRLVYIYERLHRGELAIKNDLAHKFNVSEKSIQRDIDDLRAYLADSHQEGSFSIEYDRRQKGYSLVSQKNELLTKEEVLAVCKILLESRAFCKEELDGIIKKLLVQVSPNNRKQVEKLVSNEHYLYIALRHGKKLLHLLWELSDYIIRNEVIHFSYSRMDGAKREHQVKPVAVMFSEYYFYLIAYMADGSRDFPTVFRIDRIKSLKGMKERFHIPYKDKFSDGEFRKRVQFMYSGELRNVVFEFSGPSIESVLDRFPTAKILSEENGIYKISVEVYGDGINMWLKSQGDWVEMV